MRNKKRKILFVINPKSSKAFINDSSLDGVLNQRAAENNFEWDVYYTTGTKDKEKLAHKISLFKPETIIAVGGDGTVNMVAGNIINKNINLGTIPAGSANGLAFNLGIPNNFNVALQKVISASPSPIDIIQINNKSYCLHLSDVGINARIVKRFSKEKSKGLAGYGKQLLRELFSPKSSFEITIKTPQSEQKRKAEMVVITNARAYGTGAVINPKGVMDDGKFEIVIIKPYPWWIIFRFIAAFFSGNVHKMNYVHLISTSKAEVDLNIEQDIHIDGEVQKPVKHLKVKIIPGAIKMLY